MKRKANPQIVAAAVIEKDGCILIARRKRGLNAGNWEFPGGTLEEGETHEECLKRELREELSVAAEIGELIDVAEQTYTPEWTIRLLVYRAAVADYAFTLHEHDEIRWVRPEDLLKYTFPAVDRPIVERLAHGAYTNP
jgi:8-oxo-dGTP diphosphatase